MYNNIRHFKLSCSGLRSKFHAEQTVSEPQSSRISETTSIAQNIIFFLIHHLTLMYNNIRHVKLSRSGLRSKFHAEQTVSEPQSSRISETTSIAQNIIFFLYPPSNFDVQ